MATNIPITIQRAKSENTVFGENLEKGASKGLMYFILNVEEMIAYDS